MELASLPPNRPGVTLFEEVLASVVPPAAMTTVWLWRASLHAADMPREPLVLCWAIAILIWAPVGWWLGSRYRFSLGAQAGWAVFHALFGLPGLLAFLCVQEWPARVACPGCKRLRLVDREQCEHCGEGFAPPEKTGTEVFAPLVAS